MDARLTASHTFCYTGLQHFCYTRMLNSLLSATLASNTPMLFHTRAYTCPAPPDFPHACLHFLCTLAWNRLKSARNTCIRFWPPALNRLPSLLAAGKSLAFRLTKVQDIKIWHVSLACHTACQPPARTCLSLADLPSNSELIYR